MKKTMQNAFFSQAAVAGLATALLIVATPSAADARPVSRAALDERIRLACEASSADPAGRRDERRCRAELHERLRNLEVIHGPGRVRFEVR